MGRHELRASEEREKPLEVWGVRGAARVAPESNRGGDMGVSSNPDREVRQAWLELRVPAGKEWEMWQV